MHRYSSNFHVLTLSKPFPCLQLVQELCYVYSSEMLSVSFVQIAKIKTQTQATRVQRVPLHHRQICKFKKCRQSSAFKKSADNPLSGWSSTLLLPAHCKVQNAECKVHFYQCKVQTGCFFQSTSLCQWAISSVPLSITVPLHQLWGASQCKEPHSAKSAKEIGAEEMHCHWLVTTTLPAKLDEGGWAYQTQSTPCTSSLSSSSTSTLPSRASTSL